jgi:hypothetical protein
MTKDKLHYVMIGVGITILAMLGGMSLFRQEASATQDVTQGKTTVAVATDSVARQEVDVSQGETQVDDEVAPSAMPVVEEQKEAKSMDAERPSPAPNSGHSLSSDLGTVENPETDVDKIMAQLDGLLTTYETSVLGQPGWLYSKYQDFLPAEFRSNTGRVFGVPVSELYPDDQMIQEQWFYVDASGYYTKHVGHMVDKDGVIRLRGALVDGFDVNLTLKEVTSEAVSQVDMVPRKFHLDGGVQVALASIQEGRTGESAEDFMATKTSEARAWREDGQYVVVIESVYDEPSGRGPSEEPLIGAQLKYAFDLDTGALQYSEASYKTIHGEWFTFERITILALELIDELPAAARQTLTDVVAFIREIQK